MWKYILKRLLMLIPVLLGISTLIFIVMRVFAPDPAGLMLGQYATGDQIAALRDKLGLNEPLFVQYAIYLSQIVRGDFGDSLFSKSPVFGELMNRFPATIELAVISLLIASILGITIGTIAAVKQNSWFDRISMFGSLTGVSIPIFWLALLLILFFSVNLKWLPVSGRMDMNANLHSITGFYLLDSLLTGNMQAFGSGLKHIVLPAFSLAISCMAIIARMTRSAMLEVIRQDFIRTARAKGLHPFTVFAKHALKNGLIPVITVIGMQLGALMGGAILTETIFSWPGIGNYMMSAISSSDIPVVQAGVLLSAIVFVLVNLLVDIIYAYLDPRIRYN
jgi:ABC-type dipeptide/oligopeptide/nickel transport system permease component